MKIDHSNYVKWSVILFNILGKTPPEENPLTVIEDLFF